MSSFLRILENEVQIAALCFMATMYTIKLIWLFRFNFFKEKTIPAGNVNAAILHSMINIGQPWAMESTRKNLPFYFQFIIFHIGVAIAIGVTFIIPYWPQLLDNILIMWAFQLIVAMAFAVGIFRIIRRVAIPNMRVISSLDDYFSLIFVNIFFISTIFAIPNEYEKNETPLIIFFTLTTFFLLYVPFSKISHYLYYPFTRYFIGRTIGHRGIYFKRKGLENE